MKYFVRSKVDKKIRSLVLALNRRGIPTTGSCEGHIDHGSPAPWIKITPPDDAANFEYDPGGYRRRKTGSDHIRQKTLRYLDEFYSGRNVPHNVRFVLEEAHSGFSIHNGGDAYCRWRTFVSKSARAIRNGERMKTYIDSKERSRRSAELSDSQDEIEAFSDFYRGAVKKILLITLELSTSVTTIFPCGGASC